MIWFVFLIHEEGLAVLYLVWKHGKDLKTLYVEHISVCPRSRSVSRSLWGDIALFWILVLLIHFFRALCHAEAPLQQPLGPQEGWGTLEPCPLLEEQARVPRTPFPTAEKGDFDVYIVGCNKLIVVKKKKSLSVPTLSSEFFPSQV